MLIQLLLCFQVLQELQRRYIRLEMALQYSNFDSRSASKSRSIMVTPIHETPLGGSDSELSALNDNPLSDDCLTDDPFNNTGHSTGHNTARRVVDTDPLSSRLKDEQEGSDNVSTSNDELMIHESDVYDNSVWLETHDSLLRHIETVRNGPQPLKPRRVRVLNCLTFKEPI